GFPLIGRILEQERRLQLALPGRIGKVRRAGCDLSPSVEVEQLDGHLLNGGACPIALLCPAFSAKLMQPRWRCVSVGVAGCPVALDLVDAIERDVQSIAALVLDDGNFDGALADENGLESAVDADAVLEVHDEVARLERGDGFDRCAGRITPSATQTPF